MAQGTERSAESKDPEEACVNRRGARVAVWFGIMAIIMAAATVGFELLFQRGESAPDQASEGGLAGLLLFGVLTFFFAIASLIALFKALGLTNGDAALGMPQGSIRAFMALVLIMLFFLMAVFLYLDVARTGAERSVVGVSQESYDQLVAGGQVVSAVRSSVTEPSDDPDAGVQRWDVVLKATRERSQVAEDIARQLVTVLGTLIVAIAAFYFGANSVQKAFHDEQSQGDEEEHQLRTAATPG